MSAHPGIESLQRTLATLQDKQLSIDAFCRIWRTQQTLLEALPSRYRQVMEDLLGRLETGSQFSEESCSYSQEDLLANLADWLAKAQRTLDSRQS